jgi:hypothetical protein
VAAQPIAPRTGRPIPEQMRTGIGPGVRAGLQLWLERRLNSEEAASRALMVIAALDIAYDPRTSLSRWTAIKEHIAQGDEELLDVVHATLIAIRMGDKVYTPPPYEEVDRLLTVGWSAWTATEDGLVHRSDPTAQTAFERASETPDTTSTDLREAWNKAYARGGDAADAWDHSIKAVESVLIPIVVPKKDKPNLGDVIGQLRGQPHLWQLGIRGQNRDHGIEPLVTMLTVLWPNPNRHGSSTPEAPATPEEGRALVNVAVTIVQWTRDELIVKR